MYTIQSIKEKEYEELARIVGDAYPAFGLHEEESRKKFIDKVDNRQKNIPDVNHYGYFEGDQLKGTYRFHDFQMNLYGETVPVGGVGLVAVDLLHKKERIAKRMLIDFMRQCKDKGYPMAGLYAFRPDFYHKMGFGFGAKKHEYKIEPKSLPNGGSKQHIVNVTDEGYIQSMMDCFNEYARRQHGMMYRDHNDFSNLFEQKENRIVAFKRNGSIEGYAIFTFKKNHENNMLKNDIQLKELIFLHTEAFTELLTYFHIQHDQIDRVIYHTADDHFHFLPFDVRNGTDNMIPSVYHEAHSSGVGLMYRVLDVKQFLSHFKGRTFGLEACTVKFTVQETLLEDSQVEAVVQFKDGELHLLEEGSFDVEVELDVSHFSSLMMGAASFRAFYQYGFIKLSDAAYETPLQRIFSTVEPPVCMTAF